MVCQFWWNEHESKHKIHWLSRDMHSTSRPRQKQGWRLTVQCAKVLKAKYYADSSVLEANPKSGMSYLEKCVLRGWTDEERNNLESERCQEYENRSR
jgi:hypothetical protein